MAGQMSDVISIEIHVNWLLNYVIVPTIAYHCYLTPNGKKMRLLIVRRFEVTCVSMALQPLVT
jgi:hypothetical protein